MTGAIAAIIIAIWFYKSALDVGKDPVPSAILGLIVFFVSAFAWALAVTPSLLELNSHNTKGLIGQIIARAHVVVGVACACWVKLKHFKAAEQD